MLPDTPRMLHLCLRSASPCSNCFSLIQESAFSISAAVMEC